MSKTGIKGYKVFNPDWTCDLSGGEPFYYAVGGTYEEDVKPMVCVRGFHFCEKAVDCFNDYQFNPEYKVAEVLALGEVDTDGTTSCTNKIQIVREIPWAELLEIVNTGKGCTGFRNSGDYNSGYCNSGDYNSGYCNSGNHNSGLRNSGYHNSGNRNTGKLNSGNRNSGDLNSGNWNSGDQNSGSWNSGKFNSGNFNSGNYNSGHFNSGDWNKCRFSNGCFNTVSPKIYLFNKPSEWTYLDWMNSEACNLLDEIPRNILTYISFSGMTDEEKAAHPEAETTGGYLKILYNSDATTWWSGLSKHQKRVITSIPNFDKAIFKEITGIDVDVK